MWMVGPVVVSEDIILGEKCKWLKVVKGERLVADWLARLVLFTQTRTHTYTYIQTHNTHACKHIHKKVNTHIPTSI